jgi:DNA (cytosine-5)-methyltransferase 1
MPEVKMTVAEVFAGIGGVTGGFLDSGSFESVFLHDRDSFARDTFVLNFPELAARYHAGRVESLTGPAIKRLAGHQIDGLLGCPPCEGLSPAGLRDSDDERNQLIFQMRRLVASIEPKFFVLENVPSLLQSNLYREFVRSLAGLYVLRGEVLNAAEYGIPQLRRRAVVLGIRRDLGVEPTLPPPTHGGRGKVYDYKSLGYIFPRTAAGKNALDLRPSVRLPGRPLVTLGAALDDLPAGLEPDEEATDYAGPPRTAFQKRARHGSRSLTHHRAWNHRDDIVEFLALIAPGKCPHGQGSQDRNTSYFSQAYARLHRNGLARTITKNFHNPGSGRFTHFAAPRTLTIREALRIQGFPDTFRFTDEATASAAERLVGNAFPRPLARALARHIRRLLAA